MDFQQASKYLLSLGNEVSAMKLGLDSIRALLSALGDPQNNYLKVQVAGTNGKGSVCAFLNSICLEAGIKTGLYTSPHLISMTERVRINGVDIDEEEFARFATRVRSASEDLVAAGELENVPTYFEQVTAIALIAFSEAKVEFAILETGLGGRLDATTAANAEIAAITRIDLDHQKYLGGTIEEIAAEKAAIIHPSSRVVIGEQKDEAMKIILDRCRRFGIEPRLAPSGVGNPTGSEGVCSPASSTSSLPVRFPPLGLTGRHQIENASIAVCIAEILREQFLISDEDIRKGLENARHPGRLEWIGQNILLDGAHNIGGARALRAYLDETVHRPITMIFGAMEDKNVGEITSILFPIADKLILTRPENSRALTADEIRSSSAGVCPELTFVAEDVGDAVHIAKKVSEEDSVILVTGSLYLVGEVRKILSEISKS